MQHRAPSLPRSAPHVFVIGNEKADWARAAGDAYGHRAAEGRQGVGTVDLPAINRFGSTDETTLGNPANAAHPAARAGSGRHDRAAQAALSDRGHPSR
jgi:hypothetical protein